MNNMSDIDAAVALNRARAVLDGRPDISIDDLSELLRLTGIVMALRAFTPFARPMGDRGRALDLAPDPYLPRPALQRRDPVRVPAPRLPRPEELRLRRRS